MVNTEIKLTIFFVAKDGENVDSQQKKKKRKEKKKDMELTVAQIIRFS